MICLTGPVEITLRNLETPKWIVWQPVKTKMKCSIMLHFMWVCTVCFRLNQPSGTEIHHYLENSTCGPLKYTMGSPILIVSICMWKSSEYKRLMSLIWITPLLSSNSIQPTRFCWIIIMCLTLIFKILYTLWKHEICLGGSPNGWLCCAPVILLLIHGQIWRGRGICILF